MNKLMIWENTDWINSSLNKIVYYFQRWIIESFLAKAENSKIAEWSTKGNAKLLWENVFHLLPGRHRVQRNWWNRGMPGCFRSYTPLPAHSQTLDHIDVLVVLQAWSPATVHLLHTWVWRWKKHAIYLYVKPFTNQTKADHYPTSIQNQPEGWCWCTLTWRAAVQPWKRFGNCCSYWALCCHL